MSEIIRKINHLQHLIMIAPLKHETKLKLHDQLGTIADEVVKAYRGEAKWILLEKLHRG